MIRYRCFLLLPFNVCQGMLVLPNTDGVICYNCEVELKRKMIKFDQHISKL